jgi:hypothetical protein
LQDPQLCIPVEMCDALYCRAGFENSYKLNTPKFQNELNREQIWSSWSLRV